MSEIKVNKISPRSGTDVTLGDSGDTFTIPSGATLVNSGTATGFAGISWQSVETGATFTAVAGNGYPVNTTAQACTVTLPASASVGDQIVFTDYARNFATYALTINPNSLNYQGNSSPNPVYDTAGESIHIVYMDATQGWVPLYDGAVALETPQSYSIDFLVVAGGGSGGSGTAGNAYASGGGGAGGYRTSTQSLNPGGTVTITVGTGGPAATGPGGNNGGDSSISGAGATTITSTGGGCGGSSEASSPAIRDGADGGSGGGVGSAGPSYSGGASAPITSPAQGYAGGAGPGGNGNTAGAGGGGASAAADDITVNGVGTDGGAGAASSITGASVTYAGGGGGGSGYSGGSVTAGAGGAGGGGAGSASGNGTAGTDFLGGGGGGSRGQYEGAAGGDGIVILRMLTADYSSSVTGNESPTTDGDYTVIKWHGDGTYVT